MAIYCIIQCQTEVGGHIVITALPGNPLVQAIMTCILTDIDSVIVISL